MKKRGKPNRSRLKFWTVGIIAIVVIVGAGVFGVIKYHNYQANRIYSVGQSMKYPGFGVTVTKAYFKPVDLPLDNSVLTKYGGLSVKENCDTLSDQATPYTALQQIGINEGSFVAPNPSPRALCVRRNDSRIAINTYTSQNKQINVNYIIKASDTVYTKDIKIQLLPDSGRNLNLPVDQLTGNEFMYGNLSNDESGYYVYTKYIPYFQSSLGGNVNSGLTRSDYIYSDVRNTEKSVDFSLSYVLNGKTTTKITRVHLNS